MNDSYDIDDLSLSPCLKGFSDPKKAKYRLSSIAGLAVDAGFKSEEAIEHVRIISQIARQYGSSEQIEALVILERRYANALKDKNSRLLESVEKRHSSWQDPVKRLFGKFQVANKDYGRILTLRGLDLAAEDVFEAARFVESSRIFSNRKKGCVTVL